MRKVITLTLALLHILLLCFSAVMVHATTYEHNEISETAECNTLSATGTILYSGTCGDNLTWSLDNLGILTICGSGAMTDYVTADKTPWYRHRSSINTVIIKYGVTSIGDMAFCWSTNLTNITIPDSVTSIGTYAFRYCYDIVCVRIPHRLTSIGKYAFSECRSLTEVHFQGSVPTFGDNVFYDTTMTVYYPGEDVTWTEEARQNYGGTITWVAVQNLPGFSANLVLNDSIGLNLYAPAGIDLENSIISVKFPDGTAAPYTLLNTAWGMAIRYNVFADKMADEIIVQIFDSQGNPLTKALTVSVRIYAAKLLAVSQSNVEKALIIRMLDYGALAQYYSGYKTNDLANNIVTEEMRQFVNAYDPAAENQS